MPPDDPRSDAVAPTGGLVEILHGFEDPAALIAPDGTIVAHNRAWQVHGFEEAAFVDGDRVAVARVAAGEIDHRAAVGRRPRNDGWQWYRSRVRTVAGVPGVAAVLVHRDVTDERRLQLRMAQSPVAHLELAPDGALLSVNERWEEMRGRPVGAELGHRWLRDSPADERDALLERLARPEPFSTTLTTVGAHDRTCSIELELEPVLDGGEWIGWHASGTDVTEVRALAAVADNAFTDDLTGVANRALFETTVARSLSRRQEDHPAAVLFLDLDGFKPINDTFGHATGDDVLQHVAERITAALRPVDLVARYGGDEFAVLLESADEDFARDVGERLVQAVSEPIAVGDRSIRLGVSIGIALTAPGDDVDEVVGRADAAMYVAKRAGGRSVAVAGAPPPGLGAVLPAGA
ncbi:MAG: diguanylate cyclase domain-containing protein [Acidimicrobiia bacterium]